MQLIIHYNIYAVPSLSCWHPKTWRSLYNDLVLASGQTRQTARQSDTSLLFHVTFYPCNNTEVNYCVPLQSVCAKFYSLFTSVRLSHWNTERQNSRSDNLKRIVEKIVSGYLDMPKVFVSPTKKFKLLLRWVFLIPGKSMFCFLYSCR